MVGLLTIQTQLFVGPLSGIAGGVDISLIAAALVAAVVYLPFSTARRDRAEVG